MRDRDADLDALIDSALKSYADPEQATSPRQIAAVVMARIEATRTRWRSWRWGVIFGLPALASLLIVCIFLIKPHVPGMIAYTPKAIPQLKTNGETKALPLQNRAVLQPGSSSSVSHIREAAVKTHIATEPQQAERVLPKLDVFPTPAPATEEENTLAAFANQSTQADKQAAWNAQQQTAQPLEIAKIHIELLDLKEHN